MGDVGAASTGAKFESALGAARAWSEPEETGTTVSLVLGGAQRLLK